MFCRWRHSFRVSHCPVELGQHTKGAIIFFVSITLSSDLSTQALFVALWRLIVSDHKLIVDYQICYFYFLYRPPDCQICYLYFLSTTSCQMRFFGHVVCVATVRGLKPAAISCQMKILLAMWFVHCPQPSVAR